MDADAFGDQRIRTFQGFRKQCRLIGFACRRDRRDNAASGTRDVLVACAGEPHLEFARAIAAMNDMGVAIDERRGQQTSIGIHTPDTAKRGIDIPGVTDPSNAVTVNQNGPVMKQAISTVQLTHPGDGCMCDQQTFSHTLSL
jgi:hypothetical protein